jgi:hypothetical protein
MTIWGDLRAQEPSDRQSLRAVVGWTSNEKVQSQVAVPLGEATVQSGWDPRQSIVWDFFKDFALPLVLIGLGMVFNLWEKKRERAKLEHERLRTQLAETWNSMLPETHRLVTRFYMPVEAAARAAVDFIRRYREEDAKESGGPASVEASRRAFFYLVLLERRMRHLSNSEGGFYFKDRIGELLAARCHDRFRNLYSWENERVVRSFSGVLNYIDLSETFASFLDKLDRRAEGVSAEVFQQAWNDFTAWLPSEKCNRAISYLAAFAVVLEYEMNRPYEFWYGRREPLHGDADTLSVLQSLAEECRREPGREKLPDQVKEYLSQAKETVICPG